MSQDTLISPEFLLHPCDGLRLLDLRDPAAYAAGHLPGALSANLDRDLSTACDPDQDPSQGGRHPLPDPARWAAQLGRWGITPHTPVVVYDEGSASARAWWMLRALGHRQAAVLDGGWAAALDAGLARTREPVEVPPASPYPASGWLWPLVDLEDVDRLRQDPGWILLDVRAAERFRGETEPLDPVAGRIPGARNLPFECNLDADGCFKPAEVLRSLYLDLLGDIPPSRVAVSCGSGVTACRTLLAMERAGLPGAALYVGSFSEWCRRGLPIARG